jgi:hypothetical protein
MRERDADQFFQQLGRDIKTQHLLVDLEEGGGKKERRGERPEERRGEEGREDEEPECHAGVRLQRCPIFLR